MNLYTESKISNLVTSAQLGWHLDVGLNQNKR